MFLKDTRPLSSYTGRLLAPWSVVQNSLHLRRRIEEASASARARLTSCFGSKNLLLATYNWWRRWRRTQERHPGELPPQNASSREWGTHAEGNKGETFKVWGQTNLSCCARCMMAIRLRCATLVGRVRATSRHAHTLCRRNEQTRPDGGC